MLARVPDRQFSLDPLMAEANRRARQRRLLFAGALALIVAGAVGGLFASRSPGGPAAASSIAAGAASGGVELIEAKGPAFPVRTFVLILRHERRLTVSDIKVTENGGSVADPTLTRANRASEDRTLSNEYLLQYKSFVGPDKTIRVQTKVKGAGTAVERYTSPALRLQAAPIPVLVAKRLIHKWTAGDVLAKATGFDTVVGIPKSQVESGAIVNPSWLKGKVALHDIAPNQQLTAADFGAASR